MRIRTIKPGFWRSEDVTSLPIEDRLLFVGLWQFADDEGRAPYKPALIMADLFADDMDRDHVGTFERVTSGLKRIEERGLIVVYEADGRRYFWIPTFLDHQVISRPTPSRLPAPPYTPTGGDDGPPGGLTEDSIGDQLTLTEDSMQSDGSLHREGKGREGKGITTSRAPRRDPLEGFEEFYAAYPRRTARRAAEKAWPAAVKRAGSTAVLVEAAKRYAATREGEPMKFTCHPSTWLNQDRYRDERAHLRPVADSPRGGIVKSRDGAYVEKNW